MPPDPDPPPAQAAAVDLVAFLAAWSISFQSAPGFQAGRKVFYHKISVVNTCFRAAGGRTAAVAGGGGAGQKEGRMMPLFAFHMINAYKTGHNLAINAPHGMIEAANEDEARGKAVRMMDRLMPAKDYAYRCAEVWPIANVVDPEAATLTGDTPA